MGVRMKPPPAPISVPNAPTAKPIRTSSPAVSVEKRTREDATRRARRRTTLGLYTRPGSSATGAEPAARKELPPDKERGRGDEDRQRDKEVESETGVVVRAEVDPQRLFVGAEGGVEGDVERKQRRPTEGESPVDPEQHGDEDEIPERLVEKGWMEGRVMEITGRPV